MDFKRAFMNTVTLGGHGRLEEAQNEYDRAYKQYKTLYENANQTNIKVNDAIEDFGRSIEESFTIISKIVNLAYAGHSIKKDGLNTNPSIHFSMAKEAAFNYSSAVNLASGAGVGTAVALGSWSLVGILGTASTGTAIGTLSGAAATHATMAWFGGGALAAGGGGMAMGAVALGGLAIAPLVVFSAWNTHSKVSDVEAKTVELNKERTNLNVKYLEMQLKLQKIFDENRSIKLESEKLSKLYFYTVTELFPDLNDSHLLRLNETLNGVLYYSETDLIYLKKIHDSVEMFLDKFKLFDSSQNISTIESLDIEFSKQDLLSQDLIALANNREFQLFVKKIVEERITSYFEYINCQYKKIAHFEAMRNILDKSFSFFCIFVISGMLVSIF